MTDPLIQACPLPDGRQEQGLGLSTLGRRFHWKQEDLSVEKKPVHKTRMCEGLVVPKVLECCSDLSVEGDLIFPPIVKAVLGHWQP